MNTYAMKLVTMGCEAYGSGGVTNLVRAAGAHGYALFAGQGGGLHGERPGDIPEVANIQVEVVVSPAVAETLLTRLEKEFFPRYAIVAFEGDVRVLRKENFQP